jgi:hypothetical protein
VFCVFGKSQRFTYYELALRSLVLNLLCSLALLSSDYYDSAIRPSLLGTTDAYNPFLTDEVRCNSYATTLFELPGAARV